MDEKIKRLKNWMYNKAGVPYTLEINPTNRCNLNCLYCWQQNFQNINYKDNLSEKELKRIIKEALDLGIKEFRIPGAGEPLLRTDTLELMKLIKSKKGTYGILISNGTLLNEQSIKQIVEINWDSLTVSIDSGIERINDSLRGKKGTFKLVYNNLVLLKKIKKRLKSHEPFLRFNCVITNKNYKSLDSLFYLAEKVDCSDVQFQLMTSWDRKVEYLALNSRQLDEFFINIPKLINLAGKLKINTNISSFNKDLAENIASSMDKLIIHTIKNQDKKENKFLSLPCFEPFYNMIILPEGKIASCSVSGTNYSINIGSKSLKDIWNSNYYKNLRKSLLNIKLMPYCSRCCSSINLENERIRALLCSRKIVKNKFDINSVENQNEL
jgi:MoaA/NifB/PqqE/SkfB family radical SAM enzyme